MGETSNGGPAEKPGEQVAIVDQVRVLQDRAGDYRFETTSYKWAYQYDVSAFGTRSEKRSGELLLNGSEVNGNPALCVSTPWGLMQRFGSEYESGWLLERTFGQPLKPCTKMAMHADHRGWPVPTTPEPLGVDLPGIWILHERSVLDLVREPVHRRVQAREGCGSTSQDLGAVMAIRLKAMKVRFNKSIIDRKDWVRYLVLVNWHAEQLDDSVTKAPEPAFTKFVEDQVQAYLGGKQVAPAIQGAVMNIADDALAGREVTVRAGDYIALRKQFRAG